MALRTRTLAGLYLAQGHPAKALEMIERLLVERPGDERLAQMRSDARRLLAEGVSLAPSEEAAPETTYVRQKSASEPRPSLPEQAVVEGGDAHRKGQETAAPRPLTGRVRDEKVEALPPKMADRTLAFFIERTSRFIAAVMDRRRR